MNIGYHTRLIKKSSALDLVLVSFMRMSVE
jgi:hypothetical protein